MANSFFNHKSKTLLYSIYGVGDAVGRWIDESDSGARLVCRCAKTCFCDPSAAAVASAFDDVTSVGLAARDLQCDDGCVATVDSIDLNVVDVKRDSDDNGGE